MSCKEVFRMFEGYYGPYYTPSVDSDGNLTWTNNAGLPDPAPINIKGEPGTGLEISGLVATEADLPATAEDWTCYLVGTEVPYTVYTFNPNSGWISLGQLASGPKGDPGTTFTPSVSPDGVLSWTNDDGLPNPEPVDIKGPAYTLTEADKAEIVADVVDEIPLVNPGAKTSAQTQPVGVDANGKLWTAPGGSTITVDDALSGSSTNPVQNKVVKAALDGKGTYSKPSGGIPASDLASAVQTSLVKADSALQSVPSTYREAAAQDTIDSGKIDKPSNPTTGQFLVFNGTTWAATTVPSANGVNF